MVKLIKAVSALLLIITATAICYSQDSDQAESLNTVRGQVAEVDWVASKLVVRTFDLGQPDEITFIVPHQVKITKGTDDYSLSDINTFDSIRVEYRSSLSGLEAVSIVVEEI